MTIFFLALTEPSSQRKLGSPFLNGAGGRARKNSEILAFARMTDWRCR